MLPPCAQAERLRQDSIQLAEQAWRVRGACGTSYPASETGLSRGHLARSSPHSAAPAPLPLRPQAKARSENPRKVVGYPEPPKPAIEPEILKGAIPPCPLAGPVRSAPRRRRRTAPREDD